MATAPVTYDSGSTGSVRMLVRLALDQLPEEQEATLWNVTYTTTIGQAAEVEGVTLEAMLKLKERAYAAFLAVFNMEIAEAVGIVREPKPREKQRHWPAWYHERKRCPICSVPVKVRYVGGQRCEQCGQMMQASTNGQHKRFCSGRCQRTAYNQGQKNRRSLEPTTI